MSLQLCIYRKAGITMDSGSIYYSREHKLLFHYSLIKDSVIGQTTAYGPITEQFSGQAEMEITKSIDLLYGRLLMTI